MSHIDTLVRRDDVRLITVTGLAGVGKTWVVEHALPPITADASGLTPVAWFDIRSVDEGTMLAAIGESVALVSAARSTSYSVGSALDEVAGVVVIDGADLLEAPTVIQSLVSATERTTFVVTRRSPLRLADEHVVRVDPFRAPPHVAAVDRLVDEPAVRIFLDIAHTLGVDLADDPNAVAAIAAIAERLGGLPGAIVLAASRVTAFSPSTILRLLDDAPAKDVLLGPGDASGLFQAISWSESLLQPGSRRVLRDMVAFSGPATVDAIVSVTGLDVGAAVDHVSELVDVHLLDAEHRGHVSTFVLHPLVREHVATFIDADRRDALADARLRCVLEVAAGVDQIGGVDPTVKLMERDLLDAWRRSLEMGDAIAAASLAIALAPVWLDRGVRAADPDLMNATAAALTDDTDAGRRALLEAWSALLLAERAVVSGDIGEFTAVRDRALDLARQSDPTTRLAVLARCVQTARVLEDRTVAEALCAEGLELARALRDERSLVRFETWAGMLAHQALRLDEAAALGQSALGRARRLGDPSLTINAMGLLLTLPPDVRGTAALPSAHELVELARGVGDQRALRWLQPTAAAEALRSADHATAAGLIVDHLTTTSAVGARSWGVLSLIQLVHLAEQLDEFERAARLHGFVAGRLALLRPSMPSAAVVDYDRVVAAVRTRLGPNRFDALAGTGALLTSEDAHREALGYARSVVERTLDNGDERNRLRRSSLTDREIQVLDRLAVGDPNKDIARQLGITPKTVMHHTSSIYRKLGVRGRIEAVGWALGDRRDRAPR